MDVDESDVSIASYMSAASMKRRVVLLPEEQRRLTFSDGGWEIQYAIEFIGIYEAYTKYTQLNEDTFVQDIGETISTNMGIEDLYLASLNTSMIFVSSSPSHSPSRAPTTALPSFAPSKSPTNLPTLVSEQSSVTVTSLLLIIVIGVAFLVVSMCALNYDYSAIKKMVNLSNAEVAVPSTTV